MAVRIAFVGKTRAGKTWAADYLRREHGFKKESLNDGLSRILRILYYYDKDYHRISNDTKIIFYDALYKLDNEIWVGYLERRLRTTTRNVVVDDLRYLNEVAVLKRLGFKIIRLVAPEARRNRYIKNLKSAERGLIALHEVYNKDFNEAAGVDYSIYNDTKEGTRLALDSILAELIALDN